MNVLQKVKKFLTTKPVHHLAAWQMASIRLSPDDIAIDCGANIGEVTATLARKGSTVYAFEPNPYAYQHLQKRFESMTHVHCLPNGVGAQNSQFKLYFHEQSDEDELRFSNGSSFLNFKGNVRTDKFTEVDVIDLAEFIFNLNHRVRILKMDVEGLECQILTHLIETEAIYQIDYAFVETHEHKIPELLPETEALRQLIKTRNITNINLNWV